MPHLSAYLKSILYSILLATVISVPTTSASTDPSIGFAGQILDDIEILKTVTKEADISKKHSHDLEHRLKHAEREMEKGLKELEKAGKDRQKKANKKFNKVRKDIAEYAQYLAEQVDKGRKYDKGKKDKKGKEKKKKKKDSIDEAVAAPLLELATSIRLRLDQLIRGDIGNSAPIADAGSDQSSSPGNPVTLNGSASNDPDGDQISFQWSIVAEPAGSNVLLDDSTGVTPSFTPLVVGVYAFELVVADAQTSSAADSVTVNVSVPNTPPVASAGVDQSGDIGDQVTLDGTASSDIDGDVISYRWAFISTPTGSQVSLDNANQSMPTFTPDLAGLYEIELIVDDGQFDSDPDRVEINIQMQNTRPVANAGPDQGVFTNDQVTLDGSASSDAEGDPLDYFWSLTTLPSGSLAQLDNPQAVNPKFTADLDGQYVAQLVVNDADGASAPDTVVINAAIPNTIPVADAGPDQAGFVGNLVILDGSASFDADNDNLGFNWSLVSVPAASTSQLDNRQIAGPSFVLDLPGTYIAQLIVNDGRANSTPDEVVVSTLNSRPLADAGPDQSISLGDGFQLDGSASIDADSDPLTYQWSILSRPVGSAATLSNTDVVAPDFLADEAGVYVFQLVVDDGILSSLPDTQTLQVEPLDALTINLDQPVDLLLTNQPSVRFIGDLNRTAALTINGQPVILDSDLTFDHILALSEGVNLFNLRAVDVNNEQTSLSRTITLDTTVPSAPDAGIISVGAPDPNGSVIIDGQPGAVEPFSVVKIENLRSGEITTVTAGADGAFSIQVNGEPGDRYRVLSEDEAGNQSDAVDVDDGSVPDDPADVAPPLDKNRSTSLFEATSFLYTGANPIQTGVADDTIESSHVAIIRGTVYDRQNRPLPGVTITIKNHPEYGQTLSRSDGMFDMAVNGGGQLTIDYDKAGYFPAQRNVDTAWRDYYRADDVVMIQPDARVTTIDLQSSAAMQVAQGSVVTDVEGSRQATLMFPQGTSANMVMPDNTTQAITTLNVRATEYTVGDNGPESMPGALPETSGYTYAVELSADEAIASGAVSVEFSQPINFYVDNFLGFPVGEVVPMGYYDRVKAAWVPAPNGRIIRIVSITNGLANISIDTNGSLASQFDLDELGISLAERAQLAQTFAPNDELWRAQISHMTPWDGNYPFGPPADAIQPDVDVEAEDEQLPDDPCEQAGCIIEAERQVLGERIDITGTPYTINYRSSRTDGYRASKIINIPLIGDTVPASLEGIEVEIRIAGQYFKQRYQPVANQSISWEWDGRDGYGRELRGHQIASVNVSYLYTLVYYAAYDDFVSSFARVGVSGNDGGFRIIGSPADRQFQLSKNWQVTLGTNVARDDGLGLWTLSPHHTYDTGNGTLYLGDGNHVKTDRLGAVITTVAGDSTRGPSGDGGPASEATLGDTRGLLIAPDGSIYVSDDGYDTPGIRRIDPDGTITTIAGNGSSEYSGDGGPAIDAGMRPGLMAFGLEGELYFADTQNYRVRKIDANGIVTTVAGSGGRSTTEPSGDGGPATEANMIPLDVAVGADGSLYIADSLTNRIRKVGPDGIIIPVVGNTGNPSPFTQYGRRADQTPIRPGAVEVAADGSLILTNDFTPVILRVGTDGIANRIGGTGRFGYSNDGNLAVDAQLWNPRDLVIAPDGSLYFVDTGNRRVRKIDNDGIITTVVGNGEYIDRRTTTPDFTGDNDLALKTRVSVLDSLAFDSEGTLYVLESTRPRIRRVASLVPDFPIYEIFIPSPDGSQVFQFATNGRHLRTLDALSGEELFRFEYDAAGLLRSIFDANGDETVITRLPDGSPSAIVSADGHVTALSLDMNGYLQSIVDPAGNGSEMSYDAAGLMQIYRDANDGLATYQYDAIGRLRSDLNPGGGGWTLDRTEQDDGFSVTMTSAGSRVTSHRIEVSSTGEQTRTVTLPQGAVATRLVKTDGSIVDTRPDGVQVTAQQSPDPRFGMSSPVISSLEVATPSGLTATTLSEYSATFADATNPFSRLTMLQVDSTINGRSSSRSYDATTSTWGQTSPMNRNSSVEIDAQGRPVLYQVSGLNDSAYQYDARGRLQSIVEGAGAEQRTTTFAYYPAGDAMAGLLESVTDAENQVTRYEYDAAGRVSKQVLPDLREIAYAYDGNDNLTSLTPPGRSAHLINYNAVDLESSYTPPTVAGIGMPQTVYDYNLDEQLTRVTRPDGQQVELDYGAVSGNLDAINTPSGSYTYGYDSDTAQLILATSPQGERLDLEYDGFLLTGSTATGQVNGSIERVYDNDFQVTSRSVNGAHTITFGYDGDGLLTRAGTLNISRETQKAGLISGSTLGALATSRSYNGFVELDSLDARHGAASLFSAAYARDRLGRITQKTETTEGVTSITSYTYDAAGRLESETSAGVTTTYGYDSNGNRTHVDGVPIGSYDQQDRLLLYQSASYEYTDNGELLRKTETGATTHYDYDVIGNLRQVALPDGMVIDYLIDGRNRRVGKKVDGLLVQGFLYKDQLNPIAELDGDNNVVSRFIYGTRVNVPDYVEKGGNTYRIVSDHLGSPRLVVDVADGSVVQRMDYDSWGKVTLDTNPGFQPFGFAGGLYDVHTGLTRFGARDYDANSGRWASKDPIRFEGSDTNLYGYSINDPINLTDFNGLYTDRDKEIYDKIQEIQREAVQARQDVSENYNDAANQNGDPCADTPTRQQLIDEINDVLNRARELQTSNPYYTERVLPLIERGISTIGVRG